MSEKKKTSLFAIVLGIIIIVVGAFMIFFYLKAPRYTATVTKVSNVYKTTQRSGNRRKRKYNVRVTVEYEDKDGNQKTAENIRVKESRESALPKKGDTIQVIELLGVRRYTAVTPVSIFIVCLLLGLSAVSSGARSRKNDNSSKMPDESESEEGFEG